MFRFFLQILRPFLRFGFANPSGFPPPKHFGSISFRLLIPLTGLFPISNVPLPFQSFPCLMSMTSAKTNPKSSQLAFPYCFLTLCGFQGAMSPAPEDDTGLQEDLIKFARASRSPGRSPCRSPVFTGSFSLRFASCAFSDALASPKRSTSE